MFYVLICTDKPKSLHTRLKTRPAHLEYLEELGDVLKLGGPMLDEDSGEPNGSLLVVEATSEQEARAIAESDPFNEAGIFASIDVRRWDWRRGNPDAKQV